MIRGFINKLRRRKRTNALRELNKRKKSYYVYDIKTGLIVRKDQKRLEVTYYAAPAVINKSAKLKEQKGDNSTSQDEVMHMGLIY